MSGLDADPDLVNEDPEDGEEDGDHEEEERKEDSVLDECHEGNNHHADYTYIIKNVTSGNFLPNNKKACFIKSSFHLKLCLNKALSMDNGQFYPFKI